MKAVWTEGLVTKYYVKKSVGPHFTLSVISFPAFLQNLVTVDKTGFRFFVGSQVNLICCDWPFHSLVSFLSSSLYLEYGNSINTGF